MGDLFSVVRVLGDGPFAHIGRPSVVATSSDGEYTAIGGDLGRAQWPGHDVQSRSRPSCGWIPIGIYRTSDLSCIHVATTHWPVNSIAFHPTLPLVAIGTGSYDGGYFYEGELLLLDLDSGRLVSVMRQRRQVKHVVWSDARTMDLVLAPPSDEHIDALGVLALAVTVAHDDWSNPQPSMIHLEGLPEVVLDGTFQVDYEAAQAAVERLGAAQGRSWRLRRKVWAVRSTADRRVLAALEGVALECWPPDALEPDWTVPTDGVGCQIAVHPDGQTAISNLHREDRSRASLVLDVLLADGSSTVHTNANCPMVLVTRADGWSALRDADYNRRKHHTTTLLSPDRSTVVTADLGVYDLINHYFDIRNAPDLLFLQGAKDKPWLGKWVVALDPPTDTQELVIRRLFPLEWDEQRGAHLFGGPGIYLEDQAGTGIIHAGAVHDGSGLLPGNSFVVRRAYPSGQLQWAFTADYKATAIDAAQNTVYVAYNSGELVALDAQTGVVLGRQQITVTGHKVVPLSLTLTGPGRLVIGTLDGRLLDCALPTPD